MENITEIQLPALNSKIKSKKCQICGGNALSFNLNGLSCESCKAFFRRHAFKPLCTFSCSNKNGCVISCKIRKKCKPCRLKQCFAIGMKRELIWRKEYEGSKINLSKYVIEKYTKLQALKLHKLEMTPYQEALLDVVEEASKQFVEEKTLKIVGVSHNLFHALTIPQNYIRLFIKYCKCLPDYKCLNIVDQLTLLKQSYVGILNVRFAFVYNPDKNQYPIMADINGESALLVDNRVLYNWNKRNMPLRFIKFQLTLFNEMENDATIRNLLIVQLLYKTDVNSSYVNGEFIRYFIYCHILLKYLERKYQCYLKARNKYIRLTHLLKTLHYQMDILQELFQELHLSQADLVYKEIFNLK